METFRYAQFFCAATGVVGSSAAPEVKHMSVFMQAADLADDFGHGNARAAYASDKGVVRINIVD